LKTLRQKGLIALSPDKTDSRIKYVVATPKTEEYFGTLQDCLTRAQT
jgi:DNA-binding MarR family transcriptional regulator